MREIVERETLGTSHAVGKSVLQGGMGEVWTARLLFSYLFVRDALFLLQVNISLLCWTKLLEKVASLGCVIALERYGGAD